jgi:hypothetical protein
VQSSLATSGSPDPASGLSSVVARFNLAIRTQEWREMRACCHDEAIIDSVTAAAALGADETVAAVRAAYRDGVYVVSPWTHEEIEPDVVLSSGAVQYRPAPGAMTDAVFYWLTTGKDGLMWRVKAFGDRSSAIEHFERHGANLGL